MIKSGQDKKIIELTDEFEVNPAFQSKTHKVRLPPGIHTCDSSRF